MAFAWTLDERKFLALEQVRTLRRFCEREKQTALKHGEFLGVRDWFLIELGLNTGLRVQEMTDLKCGDLLVSGVEASLIVRKGKGKRRRPVWIDEAFKKTCRSFLGWKHWYGHSVEDEAPLFTSENGSPLTKRALQKAFKRIAGSAGLKGHYSIHCLRHTFGTHFLKASSYNLRFVQEQLGHSSVRVTEVYTGLLSTEKKRALARLYRS